MDDGKFGRPWFNRQPSVLILSRISAALGAPPVLKQRSTILPSCFLPTATQLKLIHMQDEIYVRRTVTVDDVTSPYNGRRKHKISCFRLSLDRKGNVNSHLVAVEVRVKRST